MKYYEDTLDHIERVRELLWSFSGRLIQRARVHDASKLEEPEFSRFANVKTKLDDVEYGTDEYNELLEELEPALEHHYAHNSHHPEHYEHGVAGMTLADVVEMLVDWTAASERHDDDQDIYDSIEHNAERFDLSDQLTQILRNTAEELYE